MPYICPSFSLHGVKKEKVLSNASQQVVISVRCPRCGHVFLADLLGLKTERAAAQKNRILNLPN